MQPAVREVPTKRFSIAEVATLYRNQPDNSSMGPRGHIGPAGYRRVKGFLTIKGNSREAIDSILDTVSFGISGMNGRLLPQNAAFLSGCERLTVSAVINDEMMGYLRAKAKARGINIEAIIPRNPSEGEGSIVSFGSNKPERGPKPEEMDQHRQFVRTELPSLGRDASEHTEILRDVRNKGYQIHVVTGDKTERKAEELGTTLDLFARLIEVTFAYDHQSARAVLQNPNNIVTLTVKDRKPAGMCVIERSEIILNDGSRARRAELTDVVVAHTINHGSQYETHLGQNLYLAMTTHSLARMSQEPSHTIHGEYTLTHHASPASSATEGQRVAGIYPNHTLVDDELTSFAVMHIPNDQTLNELNGRVKEALR